MTKSQLIKTLAEQQNLTIKEAKAVVETIFSTMADALSRGEEVQIRGFGSFMVRGYKAYTGVNPRSGERIEVGPKKMPVFRVGKELRERVNNP